MKSINPEPDPSRVIQSMCTELAVWPYSYLDIHSIDFIQAGFSSLCGTIVVDSMCQICWPKGCSDSWGHVICSVSLMEFLKERALGREDQVKK